MHYIIDIIYDNWNSCRVFYHLLWWYWAIPACHGHCPFFVELPFTMYGIRGAEDLPQTTNMQTREYNKNCIYILAVAQCRKLYKRLLNSTSQCVHLWETREIRCFLYQEDMLVAVLSIPLNSGKFLSRSQPACSTCKRGELPIECCLLAKVDIICHQNHP